MSEQQSAVELKNMFLGDLFNCKPDNKEYDDIKLTIPEYQRIYCWEEKNVYQLWQDISSVDKDYHLGNIIVQMKNEYEFEIIDGQQRLTTLCLICYELLNSENNENSENSLAEFLSRKIKNKEEEQYIAYNKHLIQSYVSRIEDKQKCYKNLVTKIKFTVLKLKAGSLDLAYTFFSNQNSAGKALTDFELLKAHHLRYVQNEKQATHLASRWDAHFALNENGKEHINMALGLCVFRARKWMRKNNWNENAKYKVKNEYEAAVTIPEIPPFGEQFYFNEKIQGGTHFFAYAEQLVNRYNEFSALPYHKQLSDNLKYESHWCYRDVIISMLFCYYLKFGTMYLTEALVCIEKVVSHHRFTTKRALLYKILEYANSTEVVMIIDQSTSPTFFLAEMIEKINRNVTPQPEANIAKRYNSRVKGMYGALNEEIKKVEIEAIIKLINYENK